MTTLVCAHCDKTFVRTTTRGPIPKWCSPACRQAAWRASHEISAAHTKVRQGTALLRNAATELAREGQTEQAEVIKNAVVIIRQAMCAHEFDEFDSSMCKRCGMDRT